MKSRSFTIFTFIIILFMAKSEVFAQNRPLKVRSLKVLEKGYGEEVYFHPDGTCWVTSTRGHLHYWEKYKLKSTMDTAPMRRGTVHLWKDELIMGHARYNSKNADLKDQYLEALKVKLIDRAYANESASVHGASLSRYFETEQVLLNKQQDRILLALNFRPPRDGTTVPDIMGQHYLVGLFDNHTREVIQVLYKGMGSTVRYWSFSGMYLSGMTQKLELWRESDGKNAALALEASDLSALYWYTEEELYLCLQNGAVKKMNVSTGEQELLFKSASPVLHAVKIRLQGSTYLATLHQDASLQVWSSDGHAKEPLWQQSFGGKLEGLAVHPNLPHIYLSHYDHDSGPKLHVLELSKLR